MNYKTTDIILAAVLRLDNYPLLDIEMSGNKGTFVFPNISDEYVVAYDLGQCVVEPVAFNNMIKQLTTSVKRMSQR